MKPVPPHSAECGECGGPAGQPARTRRRSERYTRLRNRKCHRVSGGVTWKGHLGVKLAVSARRPRADIFALVPIVLLPDLTTRATATRPPRRIYRCRFVVFRCLPRDIDEPRRRFAPAAAVAAVAAPLPGIKRGGRACARKRCRTETR